MDLRLRGGDRMAVHNRYAMVRRNRLSLSALRLEWLMINRIEDGDKDFKDYEFTAAELRQALQLGNKEELKDSLYQATSDLMKEFCIDNGTGGWTKFVLFTTMKWDPEAGILKARINPELKPYLLDFTKNFTKLSFETINRFHSKYGPVLYPALRSKLHDNKNVGRLKMRTEDLRGLLALDREDGTSKYEKPKDIARWILKPVQESFERMEDITFEYQWFKTGRRTSHIEFSIRRKTKLIIDEPDMMFGSADIPPTRREEIYEWLRKQGVEFHGKVKEYFRGAGDNELELGIMGVQRLLESRTKLENRGGFIYKNFDESIKSEAERIALAEKAEKKKKAAVAKRKVTIARNKKTKELSEKYAKALTNWKELTGMDFPSEAQQFEVCGMAGISPEEFALITKTDT